MLSFTFDKGSYLGTYNGRFVFHAPDANQASSDNYLRLIAEGNPHALVKDIFRHEFYHWLAFRSSSFGIATVGRRYRARTEFLHGNELEAKRYYQQRTAYFCCSYKAHEKIVDELDENVSDRDTRSLRRIKLNSKQTKQISDADKQAKEATLALGAHQSISNSIVDYLRGLRACSEFGLQVHIRNSENQITRREISLKSMTFGIFNAAFEDELGPQNLIIRYLKKLRREFNREKRIGSFDKRAMARWAVIKFITEAETLRQLNQLRYPTPFSFEKYGLDIAEFAHRHSLNADRVMERNLVSLIESCGEYSGNQTEYADLIDMFESIDEPILYFFYVHGN